MEQASESKMIFTMTFITANGTTIYLVTLARNLLSYPHYIFLAIFNQSLNPMNSIFKRSM